LKTNSLSECDFTKFLYNIVKDNLIDDYVVRLNLMDDVVNWSKPQFGHNSK